MSSTSQNEEILEDIEVIEDIEDIAIKPINIENHKEDEKKEEENKEKEEIPEEIEEEHPNLPPNKMKNNKEKEEIPEEISRNLSWRAIINMIIEENEIQKMDIGTNTKQDNEEEEECPNLSPNVIAEQQREQEEKIQKLQKSVETMVKRELQEAQIARNKALEEKKQNAVNGEIPEVIEIENQDMKPYKTIISEKIDNIKSQIISNTEKKYKESENSEYNTFITTIFDNIDRTILKFDKPSAIQSLRDVDFFNLEIDKEKQIADMKKGINTIFSTIITTFISKQHEDLEEDLDDLQNILLDILEEAVIIEQIKTIIKYKNKIIQDKIYKGCKKYFTTKQGNIRRIQSSKNLDKKTQKINPEKNLSEGANRKKKSKHVNQISKPSEQPRIPECFTGERKKENKEEIIKNDQNNTNSEEKGNNNINGVNVNENNQQTYTDEEYCQNIIETFVNRAEPLHEGTDLGRFREFYRDNNNILTHKSAFFWLNEQERRNNALLDFINNNEGGNNLETLNNRLKNIRGGKCSWCRGDW